MFIVNNFLLYLSLHEKHQRKFLVCENLIGNKSHSDSDYIVNFQVYTNLNSPVLEGIKQSWVKDVFLGFPRVVSIQRADGVKQWHWLRTEGYFNTKTTLTTLDPPIAHICRPVHCKQLAERHLHSLWMHV